MTDAAPYYRAHVFFCTHRRAEEYQRRGCGHFDAEAMAKALKAVVKDRGLSKNVRVNMAGCLHRCRHEPVLVIYPEGVWYNFATEADLLEILDTHIVGGGRVTRLLLPDRADEAPAQHHAAK